MTFLWIRIYGILGLSGWGFITPIPAFPRRGGRDFLAALFRGFTPILTFPHQGGRDFGLRYWMLSCWGWRLASLFQKKVTGREIPGVFPSGLL